MANSWQRAGVWVLASVVNLMLLVGLLAGGLVVGLRQPNKILVLPTSHLPISDSFVVIHKQRTNILQCRAATVRMEQAPVANEAHLIDA